MQEDNSELLEEMVEMLKDEIPKIECRYAESQVKCIMPQTAYLEKQHYTEPSPIICKYCGSDNVWKYGVRNQKQQFLCGDCKRKFTADDTPFGKQTPIEQIGASLNMFYDGMSGTAISRHLQESYSTYVNPSTVYRWILQYSEEAVNLTKFYQPKVSGSWIADETVLKIGGDNLWFWDIIDTRTRYLLASHISRTRTTGDARTLMIKAASRANRVPREIITDKLAAYLDGIELA